MGATNPASVVANAVEIARKGREIVAKHDRILSDTVSALKPSHGHGFTVFGLDHSPEGPFVCVELIERVHGMRVANVLGRAALSDNHAFVSRLANPVVLTLAEARAVHKRYAGKGEIWTKAALDSYLAKVVEFAAELKTLR